MSSITNLEIKLSRNTNEETKKAINEKLRFLKLALVDVEKALQFQNDQLERLCRLKKEYDEIDKED